MNQERQLAHASGKYPSYLLATRLIAKRARGILGKCKLATEKACGVVHSGLLDMLHASGHRLSNPADGPK
eukprot:6188845-Pleurochrysis_carterae.AAC.1